MNRAKHAAEWIKQAEYDFETARIMFDNGRYIYCVFMCHLSLEKTLKGLFVRNLTKQPPKTHSLVYLVQTIGLKLPEDKTDFLESLDEVSVPTRYPEELDDLLAEYSRVKTKFVYNKTKEVLQCLKKEFRK